MPLLNSAIPLFAFAALVISEDCCSVASLNYSMPSLHSVTLCRCCAHLFFTPPLPSDSSPCFTSAVRGQSYLRRCSAVRRHASPLQSLLGGSTQCLCSASPSIRCYAVATQCHSPPRLAVASQCNALRALPLLNCSLPLPFFARLGSALPLPFVSYHSRCQANQTMLFLCYSPHVRSEPCLAIPLPFVRCFVLAILNLA